MIKDQWVFMIPYFIMRKRRVVALSLRFHECRRRQRPSRHRTPFWICSILGDCVAFFPTGSSQVLYSISHIKWNLVIHQKEAGICPWIWFSYLIQAHTFECHRSQNPLLIGVIHHRKVTLRRIRTSALPQSILFASHPPYQQLLWCCQ